jgi:hypothetical protein
MIFYCLDGANSTSRASPASGQGGHLQPGGPAAAILEAPVVFPGQPVPLLELDPVGKLAGQLGARERDELGQPLELVGQEAGDR